MRKEIKLPENFYCFDCDKNYWTENYKIKKREMKKRYKCPKCKKEITKEITL